MERPVSFFKDNKRNLYKLKSVYTELVKNERYYLAKLYKNEIEVLEFLEDFESKNKKTIIVDNPFLINFPQEGMKIKTMSNSPRIECYGYTFCGTWKGQDGEYDLVSPNWQDRNGLVISNEEFLSLVLTS
jgi:hypothetical protein